MIEDFFAGLQSGTAEGKQEAQQKKQDFKMSISAGVKSLLEEHQKDMTARTNLNNLIFQTKSQGLNLNLPQGYENWGYKQIENWLASDGGKQLYSSTRKLHFVANGMNPTVTENKPYWDETTKTGGLKPVTRDMTDEEMDIAESNRVRDMLTKKAELDRFKSLDSKSKEVETLSKYNKQRYMSAGMDEQTAAIKGQEDAEKTVYPKGKADKSIINTLEAMNKSPKMWEDLAGEIATIDDPKNPIVDKNGKPIAGAGVPKEEAIAVLKGLAIDDPEAFKQILKRSELGKRYGMETAKKLAPAQATALSNAWDIWKQKEKQLDDMAAGKLSEYMAMKSVLKPASAKLVRESRRELRSGNIAGAQSKMDKALEGETDDVAKSYIHDMAGILEQQIGARSTIELYDKDNPMINAIKTLALAEKAAENKGMEQPEKTNDAESFKAIGYNLTSKKVGKKGEKKYYIADEGGKQIPLSAKLREATFKKNKETVLAKLPIGNAGRRTEIEKTILQWKNLTVDQLKALAWQEGKEGINPIKLKTDMLKWLNTQYPAIGKED